MKYSACSAEATSIESQRPIPRLSCVCAISSEACDILLVSIQSASSFILGVNEQYATDFD